ncbi:succinate dehydrogenase, hydrophobic membrane anchor protein [Wenzhouxiangella sp. AB-CW3]|uniref:succinate dehydrogenase, hydrophobic membrane anchor protein n=1 Tax=Wenzhouxiangella sp. AB-CW3 TaxID=2771012 RepID=UPI00168A5D88|nr:succinate dehydrogenase, hydrophobic membrane anchor protein [Wenzhouxiangella sp. AB-CW3]QOC21099.1 succinate dehydrogenase, hydrophobic membrane anchor protein [Wenzhouxiangella sp. AB-CW3]
MRLRNPLANAHNHGSAGHGVSHWWAQRFSAIGLVVLTVWLVWAMCSLVGATHAEAADLLSHPFHAAMALLFVISGIYHGQLGMQVIIEDYFDSHLVETLALVAVRLVSIFGGLLAVIAILKLALGV